jgi:DNA invertase Pin-like site-specific DNA recombinase
MRVALYGRVSTAEQNAAMQIEELRAYCIRRQWEIVEEFIDSGVSGSKESRPALNRLLADAKRRRFDTVLVYRYDRFARSLRQLVNALAEFDALGVHFVSLHEGIDTSTPNGRLVFGIFASIAESERELIRGRVRSGLAAARARGKSASVGPTRTWMWSGLPNCMRRASPGARSSGQSASVQGPRGALSQCVAKPCRFRCLQVLHNARCVECDARGANPSDFAT